MEGGFEVGGAHSRTSCGGPSCRAASCRRALAGSRGAGLECGSSLNFGGGYSRSTTQRRPRPARGRARRRRARAPTGRLQEGSHVAASACRAVQHAVPSAGHAYAACQAPLGAQLADAACLPRLTCRAASPGPRRCPRWCRWARQLQLLPHLLTSAAAIAVAASWEAQHTAEA